LSWIQTSAGFIKFGHFPIISSVGRKILDSCNIAFGVGIVENQKEVTEIIKFIPADEIETTETDLLKKAKQLLARILLSPVDLLIVDEISKTYSGTGMDQNVIARSCVPYHKVPEFPVITRIFVRDMALDSGGNATGIGNADFTTQRLVDKVDNLSSNMNVITSASPEIIRIPIHTETDQEAVLMAFKTIPQFNIEKMRIVRIKNTLDLEKMLISEAMIKEAEQLENIEIVGSLSPLSFCSDGNLPGVG